MRLQQQSKKINYLERELNKRELTLQERLEKILTLETANRMLTDEVDKMQLRITKLKLRKGTFMSQSTKMCHNCKKDFKDSENFNWSCRNHTSQWSGEMWWCCGKTSQSAPGCKFSKHESQDFKDEEEEDDKDIKTLMQSARCMCCKEFGHSMDNCPRDPNFKTKVN